MKTNSDKGSSQGKIRIGDLAKKLSVEKFVIRFWEREFGIHSRRSPGGQRYYTAHDVTRIEAIKKLLHEDGLTIAGAKKLLNNHAAGSGKRASSKRLIAATKVVSGGELHCMSGETLGGLLRGLREQLCMLRAMLSRMG